jgi:hypothetical protein
MVVYILVKVKSLFVNPKEIFDKLKDVCYKSLIISGGVMIDQVQFVDDPRCKEDDED